MAVKIMGYALTDKIENGSKFATQVSLQFVWGIQSNKPFYLSIRIPCTISTEIVIARWGFMLVSLEQINSLFYTKKGENIRWI